MRYAHKIICFCLLLFISPTLWAQLQAPNDFLPHNVGEQFTPHYMLVDYAQHVAENSPLVTWSSYGWTNEKRPLQLLTIASEQNLARIERIRVNNLRRAGILEGETDPDLDDIAIVWLSFGVHGNETAGPESAIPILYYLANPANQDAQQWLENVVILFDPSINPDGYSRYTHWYRRIAGTRNNPHSYDWSHREPWPGGRANHYLFDLNRDWAWQTQVESRQRMEKYNLWLPHIHVDFHEQGVNSPYYFAPAARPYHEYITQWQRDFQYTIGKNHAKYFDENGWLYFTRERFDLLYPSYGDTYPTYHGAIGMTYEQGGSGRAGRGVIMENGDTLTLRDRVMHHFTAGLSTVEIAALNATELVENFKKFYTDSRNNPPGDYKTFVIKGDNPPERIEALIKTLDRNFIRYGKAGQAARLSAYNYQTGKTETLNVAAEDLIISAYQPKGLFTQILLEPETYVEDSLTYDITAWSLPYAYGLEAYASTQRLDAGATYERPAYNNNLDEVSNAYAYLAAWRSTRNARFLAALNREGIKTRYAEQAFRIEDRDYPAGTLVITRADNRKMGPAFDQMIQKIANALRQEITAVKTGFSEAGSDLGSGAYRFIEPPRILLIGGESTSSYSYGQIWYYFEQVIDYPVTTIEFSQLNRVPLEDFTLLVMPEGRYRLNNNLRDKISDWVNGGGRLIAVGRALSSLEDEKGFALTRYADKNDEKEAKDDAKQAVLDSRLEPYEGQEQRYATLAIPGAIFKVNLDPTHPLAFGLGEHYFSLKTNTATYQHLTDAWNVGTLGEDLFYQGFVGKQAAEAMKNTVVFATEDKGRGSVTYFVDNPLFRAFWEQGNFLFSNAVFFAGQ